LAHHKNERKFKCSLCTRDFNTKADLTQHLYRSHKSRDLKELYCIRCAKKFDDPEEYKSHTQKHLELRRAELGDDDGGNIKNVKDFECKTCGEKFQRKKNLYKHISNIHDKGAKIYCSACKITYIGDKIYYDHFDLVHSDLKFKCDTCGKRVKTVQSLDRHKMNSHMNNQAYYCEHCPSRVFRTKDSFRHHKRVHLKQIASGTGIQEIKSKYLSQIKVSLIKDFNNTEANFSNEGYETKHCREFCSFCKTTFKTAAEYLQHFSRDHSNMKIACPICDKRFVKTYSLNRHIESFHNSNEGSIFCDICPSRTFRHVYQIREHMRLHLKQSIQGKELKEIVGPTKVSSIYSMFKNNSSLGLSETLKEKCINANTINSSTKASKPSKKTQPKRNSVTVEETNHKNKTIVKIEPNSDDCDEENQQPDYEVDFDDGHNDSNDDEEKPIFSENMKEISGTQVDNNYAQNFEACFIKIEPMEKSAIIETEESSEHYLKTETESEKINYKIIKMEVEEEDEEKFEIHNDMGDMENEIYSEENESDEKFETYEEENLLVEVEKKFFNHSNDSHLDPSIKSYLEEQDRTLFRNNSTFTNAEEKRLYVKFQNIAEKLKQVKKQTIDEIDKKLIINQFELPKCKICNLETTSIGNARLHVRRFHDDGKFQCEYCEDNFLYNSRLVSHIEKYHRKKINEYDCFKCEKKYSTVYELHSHIINLHKVKIDDEKQRNKARQERRLRTKVPQIELRKLDDSVIEKMKNVKTITLEEIYEKIDESSNTCKVCKASYTHFKTVRDHVRRNHFDVLFNCDHCGLTCNNDISLITHIKGHHRERIYDYECNKCDKKFSIVQRLKSHIDLYHQIKQETNTEKPKPESNFKTVLESLKPVYKRQPKEKIQAIKSKDRSLRIIQAFQCDICGKKYDFKVHVKKHLLSQHMDQDSLINACKNPAWKRTFDCSYCGKYFNTEVLMEFHTFESHEHDKYKCGGCDQIFINEIDLIKHRKKIDPVKSGFFRCHYCYETFANEYRFKRHMFLHNPIKKIECHLCSDSFDSTALFIQHYNEIHHIQPNQKDVEKKISCRFCREEFQSISHKNIHMGRVHDSGKMLMRKCQQCQLEFKLFENFKEHVDANHSMKQYCMICGVEFESILEFKNHFRLHKKTKLNERNIECDICGHRTSKKGLMQVHLRYHSGETPFMCDICGKGFQAFSTFEYHKKTHSGIKDNVMIINFYFVKNIFKSNIFSSV
jgi:KRAB domain-containing zinc finger protein